MLCDRSSIQLQTVAFGYLIFDPGLHPLKFETIPWKLYAPLSHHVLGHVSVLIQDPSSIDIARADRQAR